MYKISCCSLAVWCFFFSFTFHKTTLQEYCVSVCMDYTKANKPRLKSHNCNSRKWKKTAALFILQLAVIIHTIKKWKEVKTKQVKITKDCNSHTNQTVNITEQLWHRERERVRARKTTSRWGHRVEKTLQMHLCWCVLFCKWLSLNEIKSKFLK